MINTEGRSSCATRQPVPPLRASAHLTIASREETMIELLFAAHLLVAAPTAALDIPQTTIEMRRGRRSSARSSRPRARSAARVRAPRVSTPRVNLNVRVGPRPAAAAPSTINNTTIINQAPTRPATTAPARRAAAPASACPVGYQMRGRLTVAGTMQTICGNAANQCIVAATRAPFNCP